MDLDTSTLAEFGKASCMFKMAVKVVLLYGHHLQSGPNLGFPKLQSILN